tara:strand:- start:4021 stop:5166 length:1146 start_codon:yes stop_codon:yes gene_type:complete
MKSISIFGFTGSIGTQALQIIRQHKEQFSFDVFICNSNIKKALEVINEFNPEYVFMSDFAASNQLKELLPPETKMFDHMNDVLSHLKEKNSDIYLSAISSFDCIELTILAAESGKKLLLANKESLVVYGKGLVNSCIKSGTEIIPIDSEHYSLMNSLNSIEKNNINRVFITASGGPFIGQSLQEIENKQPKDALKHPNWDMGNKITIDSATLVNKCFELIEAKFLFDLNPDKLGVLIQPQSIIHSLVELKDGSVEAQMSLPSMSIPLSFGLLGEYSEKTKKDFSLDMFKEDIKLTILDFPKDRERLIEISKDIMKNGGNRGLIFASINDFAVKKYLKGEIKFGEIYNLIFRHYFEIEKKEILCLEDLRYNQNQILDYLNKI